MITVYIELILIDNFLMDFLLVFFALRFSEKRASLLRASAAAAIGAFYSAAAIICRPLSYLPVKLAVSALMIAAARGFKPFKAYLYTIGAFIALSFLFGGAVLGVTYALSGTINGAFINIPALRYILIGAFTASVFAELIIRRSSLKPKTTYRIKASVLEEQLLFDAILDTGNSLKDMSGGGAIIVSPHIILPQLSDDLKSDLAAYPNSAKLTLRPFNFTSAGGKGSMLGFLPDSIEISSGEKRFAAKAYVVLCDGLNECDTALLANSIRLIRL